MSTPRLLLVSALAFAVLFITFPGIDLAASSLFFEAGRGFLLKGVEPFNAIHKYLGLFTAAIVLVCLIYIVSGGWRHAPAWLAGRRRQAVYVLFALLLGPGLLVNSLFKDNWGRARPVQVQDFNGTATFTPAWLPTSQCADNCSFVCGDASVGFVLIALAFVSRRPRVWVAAGLASGGLLGLMRMAQGGHFLSDVVFAFYVVYFSAWLLHRWMFNNPMDSTGNRPDDSR